MTDAKPMTAERMSEIRKICACVPFIRDGVGVDETRRAFHDLFHYIDSLTARAEDAESEGKWIRTKLKLPEDAPMFSGNSVAGQMHIVWHQSEAYKFYIESGKCDDKSGEIARQSLRASTAEARAKELEAKHTLLVAEVDVLRAGWKYMTSEQLASAQQHIEAITAHAERIRKARAATDAAKARSLT